MKTKTKEKEPLPSFVNKNGKVIEERLWDFLGYSRNKKGMSEGSSRSTQFFALCEENSPGRSEISHALAITDLIKPFPKDFQALIHLMIASGARISEVLSIKASDITAQGRVKLTGLKRSNSRFVETELARQYLLSCKSLPIDPFSHYDRFYVYRQLKKLGIAQTFGDNVNASVTHIFRHLAVLDMKEVDTSLDSAKNTIGHKSISSTQHYGAKARR